MMVKYSLFTLFVVVFTSCIKPPEEEPSLDLGTSKGKLLVLNEGLWHQNNSTLSQINLEDYTVSTKVYETVNGKKLGDTGNDMQVYGGKIYIVVHTSSHVEILDKYTLKSVGRVPLFDNKVARQPRYLTFDGDEAWVSCYDGKVICFDTTSFTINATVTVGRNPEQMAVSTNKLFVANSGGLDSPNYDKTVSVIDLNTKTETKKIEIGINPHKVISAFGKVYVSSRGNYSDIASNTYVIDATTETVIKKLGIETTSFALKNDTLVLASYNYNSSKSQVNYYDAISSEVIALDVLNLENLKTLYAINTSSDGSIYCSDANGFTSFGKVYIYKNSINPTKIVDVGLNPTNVLFIK